MPSSAAANLVFISDIAVSNSVVAKGALSAGSYVPCFVMALFVRRSERRCSLVSYKVCTPGPVGSHDGKVRLKPPVERLTCVREPSLRGINSSPVHHSSTARPTSSSCW